MAGGFLIYRFDGLPPLSPDDPCLNDDDYLIGLVPANPAIPFEPVAEIRAVFDRHVPGIHWNDRGNGFVRRGAFAMQILMPLGQDRCISLGLDDYETCAGYLRAIEAERHDWYTTWLDGRWLRDAPAAAGA